MCSGQLLALKIQSIINLRNKNYWKICKPPYLYLPTRENFAPPYTSLDLAQNLLIDRLWAPMLSSVPFPKLMYVSDAIFVFDIW